MSIATALSFSRMTDLGIGRGFDLTFSVADKAATVYLCVGEESNRVSISGTTPASRQAAVLAAMDDYGKWGQDINLWMIAEKPGTAPARTSPIRYRTHVKPYCGKLRMSGIAADTPRMTYAGNGCGRLLSPAINDRYYFIYGGRLETSNLMRGFDCTSFPMALLSIPRIDKPGYGRQVCEAVEAEPCGLEQVKRAELEKKFKDDTIPPGLYIVFSEGHVLLYNSDINYLYEFTYGGYRSTPAARREMKALHDLWWLRKLSEDYRPCFA